MVVFNIVTYLWLAEVQTRLSLAKWVVVFAPIYATVTYLLAARTDDRVESGDTSNIVWLSLGSTIGDSLLIAVWIYATGGPASPYYLLYHASVAAAVGRFGIVIGALSTAASALIYIGVILLDGGAPVYPIVVRVGYMFVIAAFSGYLVEILRRSERDTAIADASAQSYKEVNDLKGAFVQNVSHELRTPLTVIRGASSTLRRKHEDLDEEQRQALLDMIEKHAAHFGRLIQDLLDFATSSRGEMTIAKARTDLRALVKSETSVIQAGITQRIDVSAEEPVEVWCDQPKVSRAVRGLLDNAAKFSAPSSHIFVTLEVKAGVALIAVTDEGSGIEEALLEQIFESFFQIGAPPEGGGGGPGIGLHVAREIARLHGGDLTARSVPGKGSTFTIMLPLGEPSVVAPKDSLTA